MPTIRTIVCLVDIKKHSFWTSCVFVLQKRFHDCSREALRNNTRHQASTENTCTLTCQWHLFAFTAPQWCSCFWVGFVACTLWLMRVVIIYTRDGHSDNDVYWLCTTWLGWENTLGCFNQSVFYFYVCSYQGDIKNRLGVGVATVM